MSKTFDRKKIEKAIYDILEAIGENPEREGLKETPKRVAKMYEEVFEGIQYSNDEIANMFNKTFEQGGDNIVIMKDIPAFSYCEHHLALMYNMKITVAYLPNGRVLGLSKIARIVDMITKRLQLQEKIGTDIAEVIAKACNTDDVAVYIEGEHSCMTARGIKKPGTLTTTTTFTGKFEEDSMLRQEAILLMRD